MVKEKSILEEKGPQGTGDWREAERTSDFCFALQDFRGENFQDTPRFRMELLANMERSTISVGY